MTQCNFLFFAVVQYTHHTNRNDYYYYDITDYYGGKNVARQIEQNRIVSKAMNTHTQNLASLLWEKKGEKKVIGNSVCVSTAEQKKKKTNRILLIRGLVNFSQANIYH